MRTVSMTLAVGLRRVALLCCCAALLGACGTSAPSSSGPHGTLVGRVVQQPSCPVQRFGRPCRPTPVHDAAIEVRTGTAHVSSTHTDAHGHFAVTLPYGNYVVQATGPRPLQSSTTATVRVHRPTMHVLLSIDSGIR